MAKKTKKQDDDKDIKVTRHTRKLECVLTDAEQAQAGKDLVAAIVKEEEHEAHFRLVRDEHKARAQALGEVTGVKRAIVVTGRESRDVECEERVNYGIGRKTVVRLDTGVIVHEAPLTDEERQMDLLPDGDAGVPRKGLLDDDSVVREDEPAIDNPQSLLDESAHLDDEEDGAA